ncbi:MAG: hypothetical protein OSB10_02745 [Planctomycetota bacterium]|nr:hypothetical protein [Planctomycetota bacterium]
MANYKKQIDEVSALSALEPALWLANAEDLASWDRLHGLSLPIPDGAAIAEALGRVPIRLDEY